MIIFDFGRKNEEEETQVRHDCSAKESRRKRKFQVISGNFRLDSRSCFHWKSTYKGCQRASEKYPVGLAHAYLNMIHLGYKSKFFSEH